MAARSHARLQQSLPDVRSGRVVLLSHCLLNQNTRYLGGAVWPGVVAAAIEPYVRSGTGIVQLPCPEQRVWGGVRKTRLLSLLEHPWLARAGPVLLRLVLPYLRVRYARLARRVVDDVDDYVSSGYQVVGLVGVGGSPSCGVRTAVDLSAALALLGRCPHAGVSTEWLNTTVVDAAVRPGRGLFVQALDAELARRELTVPMSEHGLR